MIAVEEKRKIVQSGQMESASFGISNSGLSHILNILRNKLYSNKLLAVLREYSCNAYDAHVAVGCPKKPIKISLPSKLESTLKIRDFGPGLSEKEVFELYCFYGDSTKRTSNAYVGMMGIGSKAGFAYSDSFSVVSYQNGVKTVYDAFLDETNVGKITKMDSSPTTEPNGIEIVVAIKQEDIYRLADEATRLFRFWDVIPEFNTKITFDLQKPVLHGKDWKYYESGSRYSYNIVVIMGNIPYEVSKREFVTSLPDCGLVIEVPIGAVQIAASREQLEYTQQTKDFLQKKFKDIEKELEKIACDRLKGCSCLVEATQFYYKLPDVLRRNRNINWNGRAINSSYIDFKFTGYRALRFAKGYKRNSRSAISVKNPLPFSITSDCYDRLDVNEFDNLYWADTKNKMRERAAQLFLNGTADKITVLVPNEPITKEEEEKLKRDGVVDAKATRPAANPNAFKLITGKLPTEYTSISTLPAWQATLVKKGLPKTIFLLSPEYLTSFNRWKKISDYLKLTDTVPTSGYWVKMKNQKLVFTKAMEKCDSTIYREMMHKLEVLFKDFKEPIYVIPAMYKTKIPSLKPIEEFCQAAIKKWAAGKHVTYEQVHHSDIVNLLLSVRKTGYSFPADVVSGLDSYAKALAAGAVSGELARWTGLATLFGITANVQTVKGVDLEAIMTERYPLLNLLRFYSMEVADKKVLQAVVEYIKFKDSLKTSTKKGN